MRQPSYNSKRALVAQTIREYAHVGAISGKWVAAIAAECECAKSTVYRAMAWLKSIGAMTDNNMYIGRVPDVSEIAALISEAGGDEVPVRLYNLRVIEWLDRLHVSDEMFWYLITNWYKSEFHFINGGVELMIRNKVGA